MKSLFPLLLLMCLSFFSSCEEPSDEKDGIVTCTLNNDEWESTKTVCDLYLEESCKNRYLRLIATSLGGGQIVLIVYNYQDSICDEKIELNDYFINDINNSCNNIVDSNKICKEALTYYRASSGEEYFSKDHINDKITITECDPVEKVVSGTFNMHFYDSKNGELVYEAVNGKFDKVNYFINYFN